MRNEVSEQTCDAVLHPWAPPGPVMHTAHSPLADGSAGGVGGLHKAPLGLPALAQIRGRLGRVFHRFTEYLGEKGR